MAAKIQKPNQERPEPFEETVAQVGQVGDAAAPRAVGGGSQLVLKFCRRIFIDVHGVCANGHLTAVTRAS